ncbi:polyadenylate-binding protein-interacting protein 12-like isoform X1 [Actinidia eriantha]|uniref:polyadenylate-binding protein-interacting protein 12-like isoform X1 n=1 Tax=Actinidia eriantha TaxID=165200 RepID=UPI00258D6BB7|nr:polyadenylate-binding protein-interacting protein 12-like isoform X1 [Actinidia eriantha]XP_057511577.1 polyadenylate-binding protein-interacting protein 12-like isoform X1 [Actinidia eriantha]XP_057511578.1 polyadenylate-binding protein-interacting protein 12-like isoform X1 [Actinidia eriantha]XP_057511579.1 polyadenylate-binding protein-interacting protein 12-like isoform X1 [Actinidia eriantha]
MAIIDNAGVDMGISLGSSSRNFEAVSQISNVPNDQVQTNNNSYPRRTQMVGIHQNNHIPVLLPRDQTLYTRVHPFQTLPAHVSSNHKSQMPPMQHSLDHVSTLHRPDNGDVKRKGDVGESFKPDMRELEDMFSKLNPMAEEFVPPSMENTGLNSGYLTDNFVVHSNTRNGNTGPRKKNDYRQEKRRMNSRTSMAQREERIRRTVYVSDIDHQVTEEQLAALFLNCGQVIDCRVCGDPNSVLRFAFVEFTDEEGAHAALNLEGTMLGYYPVRVLPSKTAIAPVNPTFLPRTEDEREMCVRTIYCTNIDKKVSQADVKLFFESVCGEVYRLRLLGDYHHSTRIAFVEFVMAESAIAALNCSGVVLGSLPIRVSPSKTPVRPRAPRLPLQ